MGVRARPRPRAAAPGPGDRRRRRHQRRRRHVRAWSTPASRSSSARGSGCARPRPRPRSIAARPPRRVHDGARRRGLDAGQVRHRDPAPGAHGGARGAGAVRARGRRAPAPCRTSATRSRASASAGWRACRARRTRQAALENVALWHERDISHSSAERVILPDSCGAARLHARRVHDRVVEGLRRVPGADAGEPRGRRRASRSASPCCWRWSTPGCRATTRTASCSGRPPTPGTASADFRAALGSNPEVQRAPDAEELDALFDPRAVPAQPRRRVREAREAARGGGLTPSRSVTGELHASGKVRDLYEAGPDHCCWSPRDRISAFDVVLPDADPRQGPRAHRPVAVLVRADRATSSPNHLLTADAGAFPAPSPDAATLAGRAMLVRRAEVVPVECVARGYLTGSGWKEYRADRRRVRHRAAGGPRGVRPAAGADLHARPRRPPRATTCRSRPDEAADLVGAGLAERLKELTLDAVRARRPQRAEPRHHPRRHEVRVRVLRAAS